MRAFPPNPIRKPALMTLALAIFLLNGCGGEKGVEKPSSEAPQEGMEHLRPEPANPPPNVPFRFVDITQASGIRFTHFTGAFGKKYMPETMGAGGCFLDFDNDGFQDILLVNGMGWPDHRPSFKTTMALYRNLKDGTFADVTKRAGLAVELYGMGCAVGDFDNDGFVDLYITALGPNHLFRNNGDGTFTDVTEKAGVGDPGWGTSAAWVDYDRDGLLDLFVGNYVKWSPTTDLYCTLDGKRKAYCTPESYEGDSPRLYHNNGDGTFTDRSQEAGIFHPTAKALGVTVLDFNEDGWLDIAVANDTEPNLLFQNNGDGTFSEVGIPTGIALSEAGKARAGMGIDAGDYDNRGFFSIAIGNFANEMIGFYQNEEGVLFTDIAPRTTIGKESLLSLTFGLFFFDHDLDGLLDLFVVNGHVDPTIEAVQKDLTYPQRPLLFRNEGNGRFSEIGKHLKGPLLKKVVGRGAAYGDLDNDGDLDLLITVNGGRPLLLRNDGGGNNWLKVKVVGTKSNRSGIGTKLKASLGRTVQYRMVRSGGSYLSQSELPVTFGLGKNKKVDLLEIIWPSGLKESTKDVQANQILTVREGKANDVERKSSTPD